jgi:hypothetical protein
MESIFSIIGGFLLVVASVCLAYLARQLQLSRIAETSIREQLNAKSSELTSFLSASAQVSQENITLKEDLRLNREELVALKVRS